MEAAVSAPVDLFCRVVGRPLKVVFFEARPYWDTRFLIAALRDEPRVDLTVVAAYGPGRMSVEHYGAGETRQARPALLETLAQAVAQPPDRGPKAKA